MDLHPLMGLMIMAFGAYMVVLAEDVVAATLQYDEPVWRILGVYQSPTASESLGKLAVHMNRFAGLFAILVGLSWVLGVQLPPVG